MPSTIHKPIRTQLTPTDTSFPTDLPKPEDDGACNHLTDFSLPSIPLPTCSNPSQTIDLSSEPGLSITFIYPRTGAPNEVVPDSWNAIPGARGCTPQACSFRDSLPQLKSLGVSAIYGLSTQSSDYQKEAHDRLHLPYELLSDEKLEFQTALNLPTFAWEGKKVIRRMCLAIEGGKVVKWWCKDP
jgi:peroxiredoxin